MRHPIIVVALGLALLLVVGCTEEGEEAGELTETPVEDVAPAPGPMETDLEMVNASGVTGTVRMTYRGNLTDIELTIDGRSEGTPYVAHLHRGECGNDLGVVTTVGEFASASENVISTSVDVTLLDPSLSYFVQVHGPDEAPVACAALPGHEEARTPSAAGAQTEHRGETYR